MWRNLIESLNDLVERVRLQFRAIVCAAVKEMAKIVDGFRAIALLVNNRRHFQPQKVAFGIIVCPAFPVSPTKSAAQSGDSCCCVLQIAPGPAGSRSEEHTSELQSHV